MKEQEEKLQKEILNDAQRKKERILKRARSDAEKLMKEAKKEHEKRRELRLSQAERTAEERSCAVLAGIRQEIKKQELTLVESVLESIFEDALVRFRAQKGKEREEALERLCLESVQALGSNDVKVHMSSSDYSEFGKCVEKAVSQIAIHATVESSKDVEDGVTATSVDGRKRCVNTYEARLARRKPELRMAAYNLLRGD